MFCESLMLMFKGLMRQQCSACAIGIDHVVALHVASFAVAEGHLALLPPFSEELVADGLLSVTYPTVKTPNVYLYIYIYIHM